MIQLPCTKDVLPAVFTVQFPLWRVMYFRQKDGYFGVPENSEGDCASLGHHICLEKGGSFGRVTPAATTNLLARRKGEYGKVPKDRYMSVLRDVAGAAKTAFQFREGNDDSLEKVSGRLPRWFSLRDGEQTNKERMRCLMAGVPQYLLEHLETCNIAGDVKTDVLAKAWFDANHVKVMRGSMNAYSRQQLRISRALPGLVTLMEQDRITLQPARSDHAVIRSH